MQPLHSSSKTINICSIVNRGFGTLFTHSYSLKCLFLPLRKKETLLKSRKMCKAWDLSAVSFFLKKRKILVTFSCLFLLLRKKETKARFYKICKVLDLSAVFFLKSKNRETLVAFSYF